MKVPSSLLAVALLSALSSTGVHARSVDFAPSSNIKYNPSRFQKQAFKPASNDLQARGGGPVTVVTDEARRIAKVTYLFDKIWAGATLIFLILWVKSLMNFQDSDYVDTFPNFNKMVLEDGFCNKISPAPFPPTQTLCGIVDLILVVGSYFILGDKVKGADGKLSMGFLTSAIYTLIHGATHYSVQKNPGIAKGPLWIPGDLKMSIIGTVLMSVVMIFAPALLYLILDSIDVENALSISGGYWVAIIAFFAVFLKNKAFALTYINVTIFLTFFGLRSLLIKADTDKDIETRAGQTPKQLKMYLITTSLAIGLMCMEPLVCKDWYESIGGHVWFDFGLFLMLMSAF